MRNIVGVYKIINLINNKIYVGSSVDIAKRMRKHKYELRKNIHPNEHLQRAYNKYGEDSFTAELLENCTEDIIIGREQYYIDMLNPEYNICKVAYSSLGRKASEETKRKMVEKRTGFTHTEETKQLMSRVALERGTIITKEHKESITKLLGFPVEKYSKDGIFIEDYPSIGVASLKNKIPTGSISQVCKMKRKTAGKYIWKYKNRAA